MFLLETFIMRLNCRKYGDKAYSYFLKDANPSIVKAKWNSGDTKHLRLDNSCITFDHFESYYNYNSY